MLLILIVVGFGMLTVGMALLLLGEVPFLGGRRIPARRARLIGGMFVCFFPLALAIHLAANLIFGPDAIAGPVVTWSLFALCMGATITILFPLAFQKSAARGKTGKAKANPFDASAEADVAWIELEPVPDPAASAEDDIPMLELDPDYDPTALAEDDIPMVELDPEPDPPRPPNASRKTPAKKRRSV